MTLRLLISMLPLLFSMFSFAQTVTLDSLKLYSNPDLLINGTRWYDYGLGYTGHQYLDKNKFTSANIQLKRHLFKDIMINYDIHQDKLVVSRKKANTYIYYYINKEDVNAFSFNDFSTQNTRNFINIKTLLPDYPPKLYEVLYDGKIKLLQFHYKSILKETTEFSIGKYNKNSKIYLLIDQQLIRVRNRSSILKLFVKQKKTIKSYLRQNNLFPSKRDLPAFISLIKFCDEKGLTITQ
ncbi:hypothetical protein EMN47_04945 [Prolixibacteraceae bacterium JC049]|nr:hypothetical protein [Prolixibacteraceae bacterium JC049]